MIAAGTDFVVLTGFLGSGKTTLLRDFLALPEAADTAVIVNEVGQIGLDGVILSEGGDTQVSLLANGCVCCSLGSDLERTVVSLLATRGRANLPPPSRFILETSGLAKPGPILRSLAGLAPLRMRVGVAATFDCTRGLALDAFEEAAAQWAGAQTLVLTKQDLVTDQQREAARREAQGLNPTATLVDSDDRRAAVLAAVSLRAARSVPEPGLRAEAVTLQHPRVAVLLAEFHDAVGQDALAEWLDNLAGLCGERLLRIKGLVRVAEGPHPLLVQSVGTVFSPMRPFAGNDTRSFLVVILRDLGPDALAEVTPPLPVTLRRLSGPG